MRIRKIGVRLGTGVTALLLMGGLLSGCTQTAEKPGISTAGQLNDAQYTIGVPTGATAETAVAQDCPAAQTIHFDRDADAYLSLQQGKIDAFAYDRVMLEFAIANGLEGVRILPENLGEPMEIAIGLSPKSSIPDLETKVNAFLDGLRADGTLADMQRRWVDQADDEMPHIPPASHPTFTLKVGTTGLVQPFSYYKGDQLCGYDIEMIARFASRLNAAVEIKVYDYGGIVAAAESGAIDCIMANLNATEQRRQSIPFSEPIYSSHTALMVRDEGAGAAARVPLEQANYGVMTGSTAETFLAKTYPQAKISTFSAIADALLALDGGKTDYVLTAYTTALNAVRSNPNLEIFQKDVIQEESSIAVSKGNPALLREIDGVLDQFMADGTLDQVVAHWATEGQDYVLEDLPKSDGTGGVLKVAIAADREPMCFVMDGSYRGLDCELMERIAYELNRTVDYQNMPFGSLVAALASGKADVIISNMTATEERRESVNFSQPYFANPQVLVSRKSGNTTAFADPASARYGITSVTAQAWLAGTYPEADAGMYPAAADAFLALQNGKVDYVISSRATTQYIMKTDPSVVIAQNDVLDEACSIAVARSQPELREALDGALAQMEADGSLDELTTRWTTASSDEYTPAVVPEAEGTNGTLRVAISSDVTPICFVLNGEHAGIDVELVERLALALDKKVEFMEMQFDALLPALESGKADLALSDIVATPERRERVDFTRAYFDNPQVLAARKTDNPQEDGGFWAGLKDSFTRTFLTENRWELIADGLAVTIVISVLSGVCGSLLGFGICMLRRARSRGLRRVAAVFIRIIQGTPIVVLLMLLYYVVFGTLDISAIAVSVIGFSVNFAVYVSEMLRTGIDAVDQGQREAAAALGYHKFQVFWKVTFPQAARHFLPVFKGEFISMVKMTSVVGYIAVQDLTKVSDIIRSRTLEAFFPLIATAVLYFIIANILTLALSLVEVRLDPKRRPRKVKGVTKL